jgi:hypothetical protein
VPYARLKEVTEQLKGARDELARLKASQAAPSKSANEMITELRGLAIKHADEPEKLAGIFEQMAEVKASNTAHDVLKSFFEEQKRQSDEARFVTTRKASMDRALAEFPELRDPNSDFFKATDAIFSNSESLRLIPDGEYIAATMAFAERAKKGTARPNPLSGSGMRPSPTPQGEDDGYTEDRKSILAAMREGRNAEVERLFTKHMGRFVQKPQY